MAKMMGKSEPTCTCNLGLMVVGLIVMALGLWFTVKGIMTQWNGLDTWWMTAVWYIIGIFGLCLGKMLKWKAIGSCPKCCGGGMCK
ncbi:MAG: hypothetical protein Q7R96_05875 [Nanoarchaeota archaeon]|nr:hypothetical protein [Nanoarchaeota archaeon]